MDDFRVLLYRGASGETVSLERYLAMGAPDRAAVDADLEHVTLGIRAAGGELLPQKPSMGPLARLVRQLEPARERIEQGLPALIRSGVLDVPDGHYVRFGAANGGAEVAASVITIEELPASGWFPDTSDAAALYAYVDEHRERLEHASPRLTMDRRALVAALAREATAGRALLAELAAQG
jgi:hypothetical protein